MSKSNGLLKIVKPQSKVTGKGRYDHYWLRAQFAKLKGKGIIKRDKDVADATEYHKGNIASYLNPDSGVPVSRYFIEKFLLIYGKHLEDDETLTQENKRLKKQVKELEAALKESRELNRLLLDRK